MNVIIGGANASMATAVIGPSLGMVCRRAVVALPASRRIVCSKSAILSASAGTSWLFLAPRA